MTRAGSQHVLAHVERGLDRQGHPGDDTERAEPHDHAGEVGGDLPGHSHELPRTGHELKCPHGGREVAVAVAGSVRAGGDRPGYRDVRQGREVVQREPTAREFFGKHPVPGAAAHGDGQGRLVDVQVSGDTREGDERTGSVRAVIEGVPGAERPHPVCRGHGLLQLGHGGRAYQAHCLVAVVSGPVQFSSHNPHPCPIEY